MDQLAELVAVTRLRLEQREDQQLGGSLLQLAVEGTRVDVCHRQIVCRQISHVNSGGPVTIVSNWPDDVELTARRGGSSQRQDGSTTVIGQTEVCSADTSDIDDLRRIGGSPLYRFS